MKDTADELMRRGFRVMSRTDRKETFTGILSRERKMIGLNYNKLRLRESVCLVDTDGKFFFLPGYSRVGGGDKVRP